MLQQLFHHRWSVPILAEIEGRDGVRFVELVHSLQLSRDSLRSTLHHLIAQGLIERNPGYGHPLRPEYILTVRGQALAAPCARFMAKVRRQRIEDVALLKWSMPVLFTVHRGAHRFGELRGALDGITARALAESLRRLEEPKLLMRRVMEDSPQAWVYSLSRRGEGLMPALGELVAAD